MTQEKPEKGDHVTLQGGTTGIVTDADGHTVRVLADSEQMYYITASEDLITSIQKPTLVEKRYRMLMVDKGFDLGKETGFHEGIKKVKTAIERLDV